MKKTSNHFANEIGIIITLQSWFWPHLGLCMWCVTLLVPLFFTLQVYMKLKGGWKRTNLGFRCGCSSNASYFRFFCNLKLHGIRMFWYMVIMIKELYDSVRMLLIKKKYFFWIKLLRTGKRLYHFLTLTQYGIIQI